MTAELHIFRDGVGLDSTLPMTHADALMHKSDSVQGSFEVHRDLNELIPKLDMWGAQEYAREVALHGHLITRECSSWRHVGRRDLPAEAFRGEETVCLRCRMAEEAKLAMRAPKPEKWLKRFRLQKTRG